MNSIKTQTHMVQRYASYDRSSEEERRVDALALRADERRDKLSVAVFPFSDSKILPYSGL